MNYEAQQRIEHLSKRIRLIKEVNNYPLKDRNVLDLDNIWRLGDLLSELIYHSELETPALTKKILEEQYNLFVEKDKFSLKELLERHWIRIVMERVEIPSVIRSASRDAEKMKPDRIDLITAIANTIEKSAEKCITEIQLIEILGNYNQTSGLPPVNLFEAKKLVNSKWLNQDLFVLKTSSEYFLLLKKEECSFKFISQIIKDFKLGDKNPYKISKEKANDIIQKHRILYSDCPTLQDFIDDLFFTEIQDCVHFMISYTSKHNYWDILSDAIAGKLWNKIKSDTKYKENNEKIEVWLDKIFANHSYATNCIKYIEQKNRNAFLTLIEERVLNEADIQGCDEELNKLWLEESLDRSIEILVNPIKVRFNEKQTPVEKYILVRDLQRGQHNFFYSDYCRKRLDFLTHVLIRYGRASENPILPFPHIIRLLKESTNKPYLLWETTLLIKNIRPEIIPYLFIESEMEELGMMLLRTISLNQHAVGYSERIESGIKINKLKAELFEEGLIALLKSINTNSNKTINGQILARLAISSAKLLFYKPSNYDWESQLHKQTELDAYDRFWEIISDFEIETSIYTVDGIERPKYFLLTVDSFLNELEKEDIVEGINEFYSPDIWKIDILIRVLNVLGENKYLILDKNSLKKTNEKVINQLQKKYFSYFQKTKIKIRGHSTSDIEERNLRLSETFGMKWISWSIYFEALNDEQREIFLSIANSSFDLSKIENEYEIHLENEAENKIQRLRLHTQVMLSIYNEMIKKGDANEPIIQHLENKLTSIFGSYSINNIKENKVDIFNKNFERYIQTRLFDDFLETSNYFIESNRRKIIDGIVSNPFHFDRVLQALNTFISVGDQASLKQKISKKSLTDFLKKQNWATDIEHALIHAINNPELVKFAQMIIDFIDKRFKPAIKNDIGHQIFLYKVKLLLAFRKRNEKLIDLIPIPDKVPIQESKDLSWRKDYYKSLLIKDKNIAIQKMNNLTKSDYLQIDVVNSLFLMQMENTKEKCDSDHFIRNEKLQNDFNSYCSLLKKIKPEDAEYSRNHTLFNKLKYFNIMEMFDDFDLILSQVNKADIKSKEIAELIINNKIQRGYWKEASSFINGLIKYHEHRNKALPSFITDLQNILGEQTKHIENLKDTYNQILALSPEKLIKTIPDVINPYQKNYGRFLLHELMTACHSFQNKMYALKKANEIKKIAEDKITDLLEIILNARLSAWGLQWNSQTRLGTTGKKSNELARADQSIKFSNTTLVAEAVRIYSYSSLLKSKQSLNEHILKAFKGTSSPKYFYYLIYYQARNFDSDWDKFILEFLPNVSFPKRYKRVELPLQIKEGTNPNLKSAYTSHQNDVTCYYLFVNLNYAN